MKIDHLIYAAPDLGAAVDDLERRFGVRAAFGGKHVGLGTHNALVALGATTYLEVIAADPEQPVPSMRRPFGIDNLTEPRMAGWAVACDDIAAAIGHARSGGFDPGGAIPMERANAAGTVLRWRLTLNALDGGPIPFFIDWGDTQHPARSAPHGLTLDSFEIEHTDASGLSATLQALGVDVPVKPATRTALIAHVDVPVKPATRTALIAHLRSPNGVRELR